MRAAFLFAPIDLKHDEQVVGYTKFQHRKLLGLASFFTTLFLDDEALHSIGGRYDTVQRSHLSAAVPLDTYVLVELTRRIGPQYALFPPSSCWQVIHALLRIFTCLRLERQAELAVFVTVFVLKYLEPCCCSYSTSKVDTNYPT